VLIVDNLLPHCGGRLFNIEPFKERVQVDISDLRDAHALPHLVRDREIIFNLAGQSSHLDSMRDPFSDLEMNCTAQLRLLEACHHHNPNTKIVFASTRQIYGHPAYLPVDEKHVINPADINGVNKIAGEWYHMLYNHVHRLRTTALRLTNTYGPRMRIKDARQTFLGAWIRAVLEGKPIDVWDGGQLRDFTYVDDCIDALLLAADAPQCDGHAFNVGGDCVVSLVQLAELLIVANGGGTYEVHAFPADRKQIDIGDYHADDRLFRHSVGWQPNVGLTEGLRRTLAYYREHLQQYL
jgi:UDP-glucose 4-epimerase